MKKLLLVLLMSIGSFSEEISTDIDMFVNKSFLIAKSTKSYKEAKSFSEKISKTLGIGINYRRLVFNKSEFLSFSKEECTQNGWDYPCFIPRGRYDDGVYISIEHTNWYDEFSNGYYIVVLASGKDAPKTLAKVKKHYSDAYVKKAKVYVGCMH